MQHFYMTFFDNATGAFGLTVYLVTFVAVGDIIFSYIPINGQNKTITQWLGNITGVSNS